VADFDALKRELVAARAPVVRNEGNHLAVRALCDVLQRQLEPDEPASESLAPVFEAVARGDRLTDHQVIVLFVETADLLEYYEAQDSYETPELDALARRSRIRLVRG
jgi:hypothetical protein